MRVPVMCKAMVRDRALAGLSLANVGSLIFDYGYFNYRARY